MQQLGFRSVFAKLFASVMLALILFAVAMVLLTQLVHDKDAGIRSNVLATQILGQVDPFLHELNLAISNDNRLQSRFMLAVIKKSFDIFDESLQAKMGIYDHQGRLLMQTDNSDLPLMLPPTPSLFSRVFPSFSDTPPTQQAQVYSSTGYTLLYESRISSKKPALSAALNLFTGTLLLLLIMAGVLWIIARTMTWRINQMSQQMTQLGDGDFTVRVNARGNDEIASLARGFNQAAQKIEHLINANNLLLAHASHELRTPITRIRLQIEMMDMLAEAMPTTTKSKFDKRAQAINRDLSGLNDLVESILLVSRLDAGHVMQQVERLDLYDLVNQERQHYPEGTLIGEHIVIDGQPSMLTHLIRNLLNNAVLHGVPPVTVFLYGVQDIAEAQTIPDYLLQSVLDSSFASHDNLEYDDYAEALTLDDESIVSEKNQHIKPQPEDSALNDTSEQTSLPPPIIYRNGETLNFDAGDSDSDSIQETSGQNSSKDDANKEKQLEGSQTPAQKHLTDDVDNSLLPTDSQMVNDSLVNNYYKLSIELTDKIKKMMWRAIPDEPLAKNNDNLTATIDDTDANAVNNNIANNNISNNNISNNNTSHNSAISKIDENNVADEMNKTDSEDSKNAALAAPKKESLFKKHLKKSKSEPIRPSPKYAVLAVIDEGKGIPKDKREEIFSPFVRLQQKNKGSGLGLSLVSQIVAAHQGRITTDTINGHTRFLVIIPVKHDPHYLQHD